ncbi:MAG TPA: hypothetical protein VG106_01310 [Vicinamibacterales bacterium]|nr:hypothetical protein [Vicinamibacterales bacterium]
MSRVTTVCVLLLSLVAIPEAYTADKKDPNADAAFARLTALVGEWKTEDGKETLVYELTAGGTAVLEREIAEGRAPMVTLYHRDGERLVLTHYCMTGNQPRMVARPYDAGSRELAFEFASATNLASRQAGHMRNMRIRFVDPNQIESEWEFYEGGKRSMTVSARYTRVR